MHSFICYHIHWYTMSSICLYVYMLSYTLIHYIIYISIRIYVVMYTDTLCHLYLYTYICCHIHWYTTSSMSLYIRIYVVMYTDTLCHLYLYTYICCHIHWYTMSSISLYVYMLSYNPWHLVITSLCWYSGIQLLAWCHLQLSMSMQWHITCDTLPFFAL